MLDHDRCYCFYVCFWGIQGYTAGIAYYPVPTCLALIIGWMPTECGIIICYECWEEVLGKQKDKCQKLPDLLSPFAPLLFTPKLSYPRISSKAVYSFWKQTNSQESVFPLLCLSFFIMSDFLLPLRTMGSLPSLLSDSRTTCRGCADVSLLGSVVLSS